MQSTTNPLTYALITPSFRLDYERAALLVETVDRHVAEHVRHYLVVDRRDVRMFKPLASPRTQILVVEEVAPWWLLRVPGIRRFWLSLKSRPVRNWIMQQIVKLSVSNAISEDVLLFVDSDVFFVAPYDPRLQEREGRVPLFIETGRAGLISFNDRWHGVASKLLGLPVKTVYDTNFVGNVICWRRDNLPRLHQRLAEIAGGGSWALAIAPLPVFSEYILYGVYAVDVLGEQSGHWHDDVDRTLCHWETTPLNQEGLKELKSRLASHHHTVMVSTKSRTTVEDIRKVFLSSNGTSELA